MPDIKPFRAFVYGDDSARTLDDWSAQAYDVISPAGRDALVKKTDKILFEWNSPQEIRPSGSSEAAQLWNAWNEQGVLQRSQTPAFYVYEAKFRSPVDGRPLVRRGFFAALKVVPWGQGVYPHEKTLPTAKVDRLLLL